MSAPPGPRRVLVVDDEVDIREALRDAIGATLQAEVDVACDAEEALALVAQGKPYDVILTDDRMPGMRGTELLPRLKVALPQSTCILMSAYYETAAGEALAAKLGAATYLPKPISLKRLLVVIRDPRPG